MLSAISPQCSNNAEIDRKIVSRLEPELVKFSTLRLTESVITQHKHNCALKLSGFNYSPPPTSLVWPRALHSGASSCLSIDYS